MEVFVITLTAKPGSEHKVSDFYISQQAEYAKAPGFRGRRLLRARPGTMVAAVRKHYSAEELARHPAEHHGKETGVPFVIIEEWDSVDDRMNFTRQRDKTPDKDLFPHLEPAHTHEFYTDITPA